MRTHQARWTAVLALGLGAGLLNCSSSSSAGGTGASSTSGMTATAVIDTQGGTLTLGSLTLVVPPGDVTGPTTFQVTQTTDPAPAGYVGYSPVYRFAPAGLVFSSPLTVIMPYTGDASRAKLYWSQSTGTGYDALASQVGTSTVTAQVSHFSNGFVGAPSLSGAGGSGGTGGVSATSSSGSGGAPTTASSSGSGGAPTTATTASSTSSTSSSASGGPPACGSCGGPGQACCDGEPCLVGYSCSAGVCVETTPGCGNIGGACCDGPLNTHTCHSGFCGGSGTNLICAPCGGVNQQQCGLSGSNDVGGLVCVGGTSNEDSQTCSCCGTENAHCCTTGPAACGSGLTCDSQIGVYAAPTCVASTSSSSSSGGTGGASASSSASSSGASSSSSSGALPPPTVLQSHAAYRYATGIAVDATSVYWLNTGSGTTTVAKCAIGGCAGSPTVLTTESGTYVVSLAQRGSLLYWTTSLNASGSADSGAVAEVSIGGGALTTLASGQAGATGLAVDATNVYWTNAGDDPSDSQGTVVKMPIGGGAITVLASGQYAVTNVAVDATNVYWTNGAAPGSGGNGNAVMKCAIAGCGGVPTMLAANQYNARAITADGTNVYWTSFSSSGTLMQVPTAGGTPVMLASNLDYPQAVAVDATNVYWTSSGTISKVPIGGGVVTVLATGQNGPGAIAVDATNLYWSSVNDGTVMQLAK